MEERFQELTRYKEELKKSDLEFLDFKVIDPIGRWRHVSIPKSNLNENFLNRGIGFDASSYGYSGVEDSDMLLIPDIKTARVEPTRENDVLSVIGDIFQVEKDGNIKPFTHDPRRTVARAQKYLEKNSIADSFFISPEFEFYLFDNARFSYGNGHGIFDVTSSELMEGKVEKKLNSSHPVLGDEGYHAPRPKDDGIEFRNKVVSFLEKEGISAKYHHHEGGPGQSEIEVGFNNLLAGADNTLYIKHITKVFAQLSGKSATFMPKPIGDAPGSGMHLHQYLLKEGKNLFAGEEYEGLSQIALYFIGGLLEHGKSLMGLTNPTTNSYKRLVPGQEAPADMIFAKSNRSAAIRIPGYVRSEEKRRIELRTIDGSCNPYLAYSATLMAGLDGIEKEIDPREEGYGPLEENIYEISEKESLKSAPVSLTSSLNFLEEDYDYLLKGGVFKKSQIEDWLKVKREESSEFQNKPHPYEHVLYYDI